MRRSTGIKPARREDGFSLVEILVVMVAGMIVALTTFSVLDFTMHESAAATDRVEATARGRTAMEQVMQELHSSCVAAEATPVWPGSDASHLWFMSAFSSSPVVSPYLHEVYVNNGNLTDAEWAPSGGTSPNWTFNTNGAPTSTRTMLAKVAGAQINDGVAPLPPATKPLFRYYQYVNGAPAELTNFPLSATDAGNTVEVTVTLAAQPSDAAALTLHDVTDRSVNLTDSALLRGYITGTATPKLPCI